MNKIAIFISIACTLTIVSISLFLLKYIPLVEEPVPTEKLEIIQNKLDQFKKYNLMASDYHYLQKLGSTITNSHDIILQFHSIMFLLFGFLLLILVASLIQIVANVIVYRKIKKASDGK